MKLFGTPNLVTVGTKHVTITTVTTQPDEAAVTACTCGHQCTNPANCAGWAHTNHLRRHRGSRR